MQVFLELWTLIFEVGYHLGASFTKNFKGHPLIPKTIWFSEPVYCDEQYNFICKFE